MFTWPSSWAYRVWAFGLWGLFLLVLVLLPLVREAGVPASILWTLAAVSGITVAIQFYLAYRLIARQDEFVRAVTAKRMIAAAGLTVTLASGRSVAEQFIAAPHVPMWLIYPFFWGAFGLVSPLIGDSRP